MVSVIAAQYLFTSIIDFAIQEAIDQLKQLIQLANSCDERLFSAQTADLHLPVETRKNHTTPTDWTEVHRALVNRLADIAGESERSRRVYIETRHYREFRKENRIPTETRAGRDRLPFKDKIWAECLGRVDGFDQDKGADEGDEGSEVLRGFLAAQGDAFEALDFADALLDAGAPLVEDPGKECRLCGGVLAVRNGGADAAPARCLSVGPGVVTFVAENRPGRDVGADVEQDFEIAAVAGLAASQMKGQRQTIEIGLQVDFAGKAAARAAESLALLPPFAPAAETWARTTVESTI